MDFDPEILIEEVRKRPALWDMSCEDYRAKDVKAKCWREIAAVFDPNGKASKRDRAELVRQVQRKYKSLRDCFGREVLRRKQPGSQRRRTYMYYRQLSFLLSARGDADVGEGAGEGEGATTLKLEPQQPDADEDSSDGAWRKPSWLHKRNRPRVSPPRTAPAPATGGRVGDAGGSSGGGGGSGSGNGESERMFLLSLVEPLRQVPARMRLAVQMDMMSVIQNALNHPEVVLADANVAAEDAAEADLMEEDDDDDD